MSKRCGKTRTADIRKSYANRIIKARKETVNAIPGTETTAQSCHNAGLDPSSASSLGKRALSGGSRRTYPSSVSSLSTPGADQGLDGCQTKTLVTSQDGQRFIHFMVPAGALLLNEIESQHLCDRAVFKQMKERYKKAKGIKRWFTRLEFDRCEWFQASPFSTSVIFRAKISSLRSMEDDVSPSSSKVVPQEKTWSTTHIHVQLKASHLSQERNGETGSTDTP